MAGPVEVVWCVWGSVGNGPIPADVTTGRLPDSLSDAARRALQLLAIDHDQAEAAASAELADTEAPTR